MKAHRQTLADFHLPAQKCRGNDEKAVGNSRNRDVLAIPPNRATTNRSGPTPHLPDMSPAKMDTASNSGARMSQNCGSIAKADCHADKHRWRQSCGYGIGQRESLRATSHFSRSVDHDCLDFHKSRRVLATCLMLGMTPVGFSNGRNPVFDATRRRPRSNSLI